jgi:hypothetical protein
LYVLLISRREVVFFRQNRIRKYTSEVKIYYITPDKPHYYMVCTCDLGKNVGDEILLGRFCLPVRMRKEDLFEKRTQNNRFPVN